MSGAAITDVYRSLQKAVASLFVSSSASSSAAAGKYDEGVAGNERSVRRAPQRDMSRRTALQTPELHGPPRYFTIDWPKSKTSVETLAALRPDLVVTGHGRAMQGPNVTEGLQTLAREFDRIAVPNDGEYVRRPATVEDGSAYIRS